MATVYEKIEEYINSKKYRFLAVLALSLITSIALALGLGVTTTTGHGIKSSASGEYGDAIIGNASGEGAYGGNFNALGLFGFGVYISTGVDASHGARITARGSNSYGAKITSENYRGMYAKGGPGWYDAYFDGDQGIRVGGSCVGCALAVIAQNSGNVALEKGDMVALTGVTTSFDPNANQPVMTVAKVDPNNQNVVFGVVSVRYIPELMTKNIEDTEDSERFSNDSGKTQEESGHTSSDVVESGDYVVVVYHGMAQVKVDAASSSIKVGDRLLSGSGFAVSAKAGDFKPDGGVKLQALENLQQGNGLVWSMLR